jgi:hypothetical protein
MRDDDAANLLYLVRFGLTASGLEIEDFGHVIARENVVIAAHALDEPEMQQQRPKIVKSNVCV